jgi:HemY protein
MIKLLWRFALLIAAALLFAWLADRPGTITIRWMGREIETSVLAGVALSLVVLLALSFVWQVLRRILRSPTAAREFWRFRKHRKAYESLSKGIIAAGAGDAQLAAKHAAIAGNTLSDEPLVNVLAAQAAQLKGDRTSMRRIFEEMAKSPETELMGLRGLFAEARQSGDLVAALGHAERALARNPRLPWASSAVLQVQTARKLWLPAAETLAQQGRAGVMPRDESNRKRAALMTADAIAREDTERGRALELASEALKLDPALVPAASVAARCHIADGSQRRAMKMLRATWENAKHPDLAELMAHSVPGDGPEARFERVRDFVGDPESHIESACALARAALSARRLDVARKALSTYLADHPPQRVCALMAAVEEAEGDKGRAREWLARALNAPRDPMWVSDGVANMRWMPVSPVTGEIVPCEWKVPFDVATAPADFALADDGAPDAAVPALSANAQPGPIKPVEFHRPPDDPGPAGPDLQDS